VDARSARNLALLALPRLGTGGAGAVAVAWAAVVAALVLLTRRAVRGRLAVVPMFGLGVMLVLDLAAARDLHGLQFHLRLR